VGRVLARDGFEALGVNRVAQEAGVDKVLIYRYFEDLPGLVLAFSRTVDFWPGVDELMGPDPDAVSALGADEQLAFFFKSLLRALRRRPNTLKILVWRQAEANVLAKQIDDVRMRSALEFFERLENIPVEPDFTAVVVLLYTAIFGLLCRSQTRGTVGGIDLTTEAGWHRIQAGIDQLVRGTFASAAT
jgi:AcrR family transcriptional regulator